MEKCGAHSLYMAISDVLHLNINLQNCFGVTFDAASAFSEHVTGVGIRILEITASAIQTHCLIHCVNFAVQDVVEAVPPMRDFLHLSNDPLVFLRRLELASIETNAYSHLLQLKRIQI